MRTHDTYTPFPRKGLRIHDWGAGCGSVILPLQRRFRPEDTFIGVDVDAFNVDSKVPVDVCSHDLLSTTHSGQEWGGWGGEI